MTTPSFHQSLGLGLVASDPLWLTTPTMVPLQLAEQVSGWVHAISADVGYDSASFTVAGNQQQVEDWIDRGLGRDIKAYNVGQNRIWEGFVNHIKASIGSLSVDRGPLLAAANKARLVYSTIDWSVDPPVVGIRAPTDWAEDADSQARYGIIEKVLSTGGATATGAEQIRDTFLNENKEPQTGQAVNISFQETPTVTLECLGYKHWFKAFAFNTTATGSVTISQRIQDVINADPNSIISTDFSQIATNASVVKARDDDDRSAWAVLKGLTVRGDSSFNRHTLAVYNDQIVYYAAIPTGVEYAHRITAEEMRIEKYDTAQRVYPWDVQPAKWVFFPDFLIGRVQPASLREDPRNMFIETIRYTAPWGLELNGVKVGKLKQLLGQMGLSGIGA